MSLVIPNSCLAGRQVFGISLDPEKNEDAIFDCQDDMNKRMSTIAIIAISDQMMLTNNGWYVFLK